MTRRVRYTRAGVLKRALLLSVVVGLMASPVSSQPSHDIVLFSDDECTSCNLQIAQGETKSFYIKLRGDGPGSLGQGQIVNFRVAGVPESWPYSVMLGPHVLEAGLFGDPLGDEVAASVDAPDENSCVTLFIVELTATTTVQDLIFSVEAPTLPNPNFPCPLLTLCAPCDEKICVPGGKLLVNSEHDCTVAVTSHTWSAVRQLYR